MVYTFQLVLSFLGALFGGIVVAVINWVRTSKSEKTTRKHEFLKEQIAKLYGPLYFFAGLNEALFVLNDKFHKAYKEHFIDENWSTDPDTRDNLNKASAATLGTANYYVNLCRDNNAKIIKVLQDNYAYIDPEDTAVFQQFVIDHLRMEREFKADTALETPLEIYYKVGEISYSRPEFLELIRRRFTEKVELIKSIQGANWVRDGL
jgi:hypothetical protein